VTEVDGDTKYYMYDHSSRTLSPMGNVPLNISRDGVRNVGYYLLGVQGQPNNAEKKAAVAVYYEIRTLSGGSGMFNFSTTSNVINEEQDYHVIRSGDTIDIYTRPGFDLTQNDIIFNLPYNGHSVQVRKGVTWSTISSQSPLTAANMDGANALQVMLGQDSPGTEYEVRITEVDIDRTTRMQISNSTPTSLTGAGFTQTDTEGYEYTIDFSLVGYQNYTNGAVIYLWTDGDNPSSRLEYKWTTVGGGPSIGDFGEEHTISGKVNPWVNNAELTVEIRGKGSTLVTTYKFTIINIQP